MPARSFHALRVGNVGGELNNLGETACGTPASRKEVISPAGGFTFNWPSGREGDVGASVETRETLMKFGIHNPSWFYGPDPAEAFEAVKAKAQRAENHGFVWFSVMDHLIQIGGVGAPDEPFMEGWTVLSALAAVTSRIRLATLAT